MWSTKWHFPNWVQNGGCIRGWLIWMHEEALNWCFRVHTYHRLGGCNTEQNNYVKNTFSVNFCRKMRISKHFLWNQPSKCKYFDKITFWLFCFYFGWKWSWLYFLWADYEHFNRPTATGSIHIQFNEDILSYNPKKLKQMMKYFSYNSSVFMSCSFS